MTLKLETHISGDVIILYCEGRLVFGDETAAFRERINNILLGTQRIVVRLGGVRDRQVELVETLGAGRKCHRRGVSADLAHRQRWPPRLIVFRAGSTMSR